MKRKFILLLSSAMLLMFGAFAQMHVSTGTTKYVLLEEGTGAWCGYCPDGAEDIVRDIIPTYPHVLVASFHNADPMALSPDTYNTDYTALVGYPAACIDRTAQGSGVAVGRPWDGPIAARMSATPNFQVDMVSTYDTGSRLLTVLVTGTALTSLTGNWNINAYVTEDSISSAGGNDQANYARPPCPGGCNNYWQFCGTAADTSWWWNLGDPIAPASKYYHMDVVRAVLATTGGIYGDPAFTNPSIGTTNSIRYTYTVPAGYNHKLMKVIGLVLAQNTAAGSVATVENGMSAKLRLMPLNETAVPQTPAMEDVKIYPNPAKSMITVIGTLDNPTDTRIVIYNAIGQIVTDKTYKANGSGFMQSIDLDNTSNGLYFMSISNNGKSITKQFVISK